MQNFYNFIAFVALNKVNVFLSFPQLRRGFCLGAQRAAEEVPAGQTQGGLLLRDPDLA